MVWIGVIAPAIDPGALCGSGLDLRRCLRVSTISGDTLYLLCDAISTQALWVRSTPHRNNAEAL